MSRLVALLTDFGTDDPYAGQVAAVVAAAANAQVVSITHGVPPHAINLGAHIVDASLEPSAEGSSCDVMVGGWSVPTTAC